MLLRYYLQPAASVQFGGIGDAALMSGTLFTSIKAFLDPWLLLLLWLLWIVHLAG